MNFRPFVLCAALWVSCTASTLHAQERGQVGLTMGYPPAVGLMWQVTDLVALRPEISFTSSASDPTSIPLLGTTSNSSSTLGVGVSALFYFWKWDALRAYVAPRFTYSRLHGSSERTSQSISFPPLSTVTTTTTTETTLTTESYVGLFGAQYSLHKRFSAFGEVGFGYSRQHSQGHAGKKVVHVIRTFANWRLGVLAPSTPNYFLIEFSTDADQAPERSVVVFSAGGHLVANLFRGNGRFVAPVGASRPNRHSLRVTVRVNRLGNPRGYRWQAFAFYKSSTTCKTGCTDRAPDGAGRILHDLRRPTVSFPSPGVPDDVDYDVNFSVADTGGSGVASWTLQQRALWERRRWDPGRYERDDRRCADAALSSRPRGTTTSSASSSRTATATGGSARCGSCRCRWTTTCSPTTPTGAPAEGPATSRGPCTSSTANDAEASYIFDGSYVALVAPGRHRNDRDHARRRLPGASVDLSTFSGPAQDSFSRSRSRAPASRRSPSRSRAGPSRSTASSSAASPPRPR